MRLLREASWRRLQSYFVMGTSQICTGEVAFPFDHFTSRSPAHRHFAFLPPRKITNRKFLEQLVVRLLRQCVFPTQVLFIGISDELVSLDQDIQFGLASG